MLAALYVGNGTFRLAQRQARPPGPGEVRLDVAYVGICGTDLHIRSWDGWAGIHGAPCGQSPRSSDPG